MAAQRGEAAARKELVEAFLPAIAGIARRYRTAPAVDRDELMQDGVVGLLRALERYDIGRDTPFWAYASWWVRQAMQGLVSELNHPVVLSDRALRQLARVKHARAEHVLAHRKEPSADDLAAATGLGRPSIDALLAVERRPRSLEEPASGVNDASATVGDNLADARAEEDYERAGLRLATAELRSHPAGLQTRERDILRARFGIGVPEQTLQEIGERLGLSAERIRQIEQRALDKLRVAAGGPKRRRRARRPSLAEPPMLSPRMDVCVGRMEATVHVDVPGVRRDALRITLQGSLLIVRGERPAPAPARSGPRQRRFGAFERIMRVPRGLDQDAITTSLADGVLTVQIRLGTVDGGAQ